jgi:hypothetical protein
MHITYRSYLTAGVAALGAGALALTPVQPLPNHVALGQERAVSNLAVTLASTIDPITPWVDTFKLAAQNFTALTEFYLQKPVPLIQTISANQVTYFKELTSGNGGLIPGQIAANIQTFFQSPWSPGDPVGEYISPVPVTTIPVLNIPLSQQGVFALLPAVLGQETYDQLQPIINFTATPYSGELIGLLGTLLAPVIQLTRDFTAIGQYFQDGDVIGAINELINIPANVTNAVLNGAGYLDLTAVVNAIAPLPSEVKSIGLNLGGLLNAVPASGTLDTPESWSGGTAFDVLAATISYKISDRPKPDGTSVTVADPGIQEGFYGSVVGLGQYLGQQMLVTPPAPAQVAAAVAAPAQAEAAAPVVADPAPAVVDDPAPAVVDDPAPAVVDDPAPAVTQIADVVDSPAPQAVSAPAPQQQSAASDNGANAGSSRGGHKGARGKHAG